MNHIIVYHYYYKNALFLLGLNRKLVLRDHRLLSLGKTHDAELRSLGQFFVSPQDSYFLPLFLLLFFYRPQQGHNDRHQGRPLSLLLLTLKKKVIKVAVISYQLSQNDLRKYDGSGRLLVMTVAICGLLY